LALNSESIFAVPARVVKKLRRILRPTIIEFAQLGTASSSVELNARLEHQQWNARANPWLVQRHS
jgi:hypothetical protein